MIALMRIDNRLIHGQVALLWTKHLQANRIIVANDTIVKNEVQVAALKMACPATAKCSVLSVADAISVLKERVKITDTVYATPSDLEDFARIQKTGVKCQYQVVPDNAPQDVYELIKQARKGE